MGGAIAPPFPRVWLKGEKAADLPVQQPRFSPLRPLTGRGVASCDVRVTIKRRRNLL